MPSSLASRLWSRARSEEPRPAPSRTQETDVLRLYSDRLVAKLEKRSLDLQTELAKRQQAEEAVRRHAKRLEILRDIDIAILEAHSPESVAGIAVKALHSILLTARSSVATFDASTAQATVIAVEGGAEQTMRVGDVLPIELFGAADDLAKGTVRRIDDVEALEERSRGQTSSSRRASALPSSSRFAREAS